jgi:site-specific recombinase XerD
MNEFFRAIRSFLTEYLPKQKCCSENTVCSYKQALNLFVTYLREVRGQSVKKINFASIDRELVLGFLDWLEQERQCGTSSRNHRLAVLRSFFAYAGALDCTQAALHLELAVIPSKKAPIKVVDFLTEPALERLLKQPNVNNKTGLRNRFFMILMYDTAARCSELLNLRIRDFRLDAKHPLVYLRGKGNKTRTVPLLAKTVQHCKQYLQCFHNDEPADSAAIVFFTTSHGVRQPMSIDNAEAFMKKYGESARCDCPEVPERVHPHMIRHTRAMHLYRHGVPLVLVAEYLGHASVETTKIYAYADTEMKRAALEKINTVSSGTPAPTPIWENDEEMILKLSGLK